MLTITTNSFENDVLRADKPVLVDFWAQWCPYCRRIAPAFDKVGEQYADTLITGKINYDEEPQLIERFGIDTIPTLQPMVCKAPTTQALTQLYQANLRQHSCRSLLQLTMSIHAKQAQAEAQKRRLGMVDERFMKQAEQLLYGELSAALDIPYDEVQPYIASRMEALVGA